MNSQHIEGTAARLREIAAKATDPELQEMLESLAGVADVVSAARSAQDAMAESTALMTGLMPGQEIRARALDSAARVVGAAGSPEPDVAAATVGLASRFAAYIRG